MKVLFYLLTVIFGALGALALLRTIERLVAGAGIVPVQIILALVFLALAWQCLTKARRNPTP